MSGIVGGARNSGIIGQLKLYDKLEFAKNDYVEISAPGTSGGIKIKTGGDSDTLQVSWNKSTYIANSGSGIGFSATADASATGATMTSEVLDDYEEGTWTPLMKFASTSATMHGNNAGRYTKIGRAVFLNAQVYITARNTTSGGAAITQLPFTSQNVNAANGAVTVGIMGGGAITAGTSISGYIQQNSSEISLRYWDQTYGNSPLEAGDLANTFYISMCAVYTV